jgi:hypothetical protein
MLRAAASIVVELDGWLRETLTRPGADVMLDSTWNNEGQLPAAVTKLILERAVPKRSRTRAAAKI